MAVDLRRMQTDAAAATIYRLVKGCVTTDGLSPVVCQSILQRAVDAGKRDARHIDCVCRTVLQAISDRRYVTLCYVRSRGV